MSTTTSLHKYFPGPQSPTDPVYLVLPQSIRDKTTWNAQGVPQYPPDVTCRMLHGEEPYLPLSWHAVVFGVVAFLLYIVWPLYVLRHLIERLYRDQDKYEANHEKFKNGPEVGQGDQSEKVEE